MILKMINFALIINKERKEICVFFYYLLLSDQFTDLKALFIDRIERPTIKRNITGGKDFRRTLPSFQIILC